MARADVEIRVHKGTTLDAWWAFYGCGMAAAFGAITADKWWEPIWVALMAVVALCYLIAFFRRSETIRAFWRGLTGKREG